MTDPKRKKTRKPAEALKPEAFDLWLKKGLHELYDTVASEPLPDEWLTLIEEDRKK